VVCSFNTENNEGNELLFGVVGGVVQGVMFQAIRGIRSFRCKKNTNN